MARLAGRERAQIAGSEQQVASVGRRLQPPRQQQPVLAALNVDQVVAHVLDASPHLRKYEDAFRAKQVCLIQGVFVDAFSRFGLFFFKENPFVRLGRNAFALRT